MNDVLMIVLGGITLIALISIIVQLFKRKVWIFSQGKKNIRFNKIGYFTEKDEYEVPEVFLSDKSKGPAIGRLSSGDNKDPNTHVELLFTDPDDESVKPQYRDYAYITPEGIIYKVEGKKKRTEVIGYTARPSDPTTPSPNGERSWKTLWLTCKLNAYLGKPIPKTEENSKSVSETESTPNPVAEPETKETPETAPIAEPEPETDETTETAPVAEFEPGSEEKSEADPVVESEPETEETTAADSKSESVLTNEPESMEDPEPKQTEVETEHKEPGKVSEYDQPLKLEKKKSSDKKSKKLSQGPKPVAIAKYTGFPFGKGDRMSPEACSAAFGLVFNLYNKKNYQEHYSTPAYGWKDTALLAGFIYAVLYVIWYIFNVKLLGLRFIGYKFWVDFPLYFSYFAIWAIVRAVKIECIERSDTIQPKLDLFNKVIGQKGYDIMIIVFCAITLAFSGTYYRFDFLPLACVLITAIAINLSLKSSKKPWTMTNPFSTDEEDEGEDELDNPTGDIEKKYQWELETDKTVKCHIELFFDSQYIEDLRFMNPFFNQRKDKGRVSQIIKDMFIYVDTHRSVSARSRYIVKKIKEFASNKALNREDTLQFILDFVQEPNIRFVMNQDSSTINKYSDYIRYPDEVLYDKEGDSNSKAFLAAILVYYYGRKVVFLNSKVQQHGAIGIEVYPEWKDSAYLYGRKFADITFEYNGTTYVFCETTADGFRIGGSLNGMTPDDFEDKVELSLPKDIEDETGNLPDESVTRIYTWDLDSEKGTQLQGRYTIEFDEEKIEALREENPFKNYGLDTNSYEENVKNMFAYIDAVPSRKEHIKEIADYIKKTATQNKLDELDTVQFALDFCQAPNIEYKIDEDCDTIPYNETSKEYMRYPDEVLFDKEGDCDCKSSLTVALFREMGYKTLFMMSKKLGHAAVAVEYKPEWACQIKDFDESKVVRTVNGTEYIYCETTGDGLRVGGIKGGDSIHDFETVVEL